MNPRSIAAGAAGVVLLLAAGCNRSSGAPPLIRFVDLAPAEPPTVIATMATTAMTEGRTVDLVFDASQPATAKSVAATARGRWVKDLFGDGAADAPESVTLVVVPVESASTALAFRITLLSPPANAASFFLCDVDQPPSAETFANDDTSRAWLVASKGGLQGFVPREGSGRTEFDASLEARPGRRAIVVGLCIDDAAPHGLRVERVSATPRGAWLDRATPLVTGSGVARRVTIESLTCEAFVLPVPGTIRFHVRLGRAARFVSRIAFANPSGSPSRPPPVLHVDATSDGETSRIDAHQFGADWSLFSGDLRTSGGGEFDVAIVVDGSGEADDRFVVVGDPVIMGDVDDPRPDVVLISLDTVRADRLSLFGAKRPTSPNLDRLGKTAVVFERAMSAAPWTLPSHASLFSGQYPDRHGAHQASSSVASATSWLPEEFRAAGYRTVAFTGGGYVNPQFGFARGFERYGFMDPAFPDAQWVEGRTLPPEQKKIAAKSGAARKELLDVLVGPRPAARFIFVHTYAAHDYAAARADVTALGPPKSFANVPQPANGVELNQLIAGTRSEATRDAIVATAQTFYDAGVRAADRLVGDVLTALERSGRLDHTIVVVVSDHGEELFERGKFGHGHSVFDELIRVPLVIHAPGIAPRRIADVVSLVDVAPTLHRLAGLSGDGRPNDRWDGRDLGALLRGESLAPFPVLSRGDQHATVFRAIRGAKQKLIETQDAGSDPTAALFLLGADPGETSDVAATHGDDVTRLRKTLDATVARLQAISAGSGNAAVDASLAKQLAELGYGGKQ